MCSCEGPRRGWGRCAPSPVLLLSLLLAAAPLGLRGEETRQVSLEVIPDPTGPPENLLHIRAVGSNSTLHYVWSSLGPPAVVLVATNTPHSALSVNWSRLLSPEPAGGLVVLPENSVRFSSALVFTRLFEFDSTNTSEEAAEPPGKPYPPYCLAEWSWNNVTDSLDPATLSATFRGHPIHDPTGAFANGSLAFRVQAFSRSGRPAQPPRLLHTADTCQLEVALVGAVPRGNRSLFRLEVATLGQGPDCPSMREQHSIDDEYAPAVFQVDAPGCGFPSHGCLVPASPGHHGGGPGGSRARAAGRGPVSAAGPQAVLRISTHKLRLTLWREGHYWTCLAVPQTSASLRVSVPSQVFPPPIMLFCRTSAISLKS
ncbi:glycosylated lysosomal membrane protein isoform X2 [Rhinolophus sinicus]|uniref:glycosylated lysosomal membrane protein isoform X2 n=1 Tax=Rhinolophus sinicus TaxID=89399 RepID=UPI003D7B57D0